MEYFQAHPCSLDQYIGTYDLRLVALSYMVAVFASYIALDMTGRLRDRNNTPTSTLLWLIGGAIAMGSGIWSMHFIGMLSFKIPGITLQYDLYWTALSLFVAIFASGFALYLLKQSIVNVVHLIAGGFILGLAIATMHYTGMEAMLITLNIRYIPSIFLLSVIIAIVASEAAIWLAIKSNSVILRLRNKIKFGSAIIMGIAISGMHYTGMAASVFSPLCTPSSIQPDALDPAILSMAVASITLMILGIAFFASTYKEALNQQQFEQARQLGMAEISASVLHNVGNVLNSVNVSANLVSEKLSNSKTTNLDKLCQLLNEHKDDLSTFLTQDPRGSKVLEYMNSLAELQRNEQQNFTTEIKSIIKNILTIQQIISAQQTLSKNIGMDSVLSINDLLDETLLISGLDSKKDIQIIKHYEKLSPIVTDKVKLLQVLVNLMRNAKDALMQSTNQNKIIQITTSYVDNKIVIEIKDNGIGIPAQNIKKIFYHGFTTKESGHGFGLHASALTMHELGGEIEVKSEGIEKGATFILYLANTKPK